MMKLIVCCCLVIVAYCKKPTQCQSPKEWEGRIFTTYRSDRVSHIGRISYDENNKQIRILDDNNAETVEDHYDSLYLYNVGKEYKINLRTKACSVKKLTQSFKSFGVPPQAKCGDVASVHVESDSVQMIHCFGNFTDGDPYSGVVTYPDCYPMAMAYYSSFTGYVSHEFSDITLGIADRGVFVPPVQCF